jgi:endoglucanase
MAMAAGNYRDSDPEFADTCAKAAQTAWQYLMNQSSLEGFHNPPEIVTGEYPDGELKDEVLWAAVELLDLVNQGSLPEDLRSELEQTILSKMEAGMSCGLGWADMGGFALYDLVGTDSENPEIQKVREQAQTQILSEAERIRGLIEQDGYFASMGTNYYWGSNMGIANNGMMLLMAADLTDDPAWKIPAKRQLDYLLGVNGLDFCYVSGVGEKCLSDPHHRPSQAVGEAMPGMLAGGPNPNLEDPYAQQVLSGLAPALCYADNQQSYSTNEVAIYWNSPLLVLLYGIR